MNIQESQLQLRLHGNAPYRIAVIHGGPGAAGEMLPVARELAAARGILEPFQTALSVQGQISELKKILENFGTSPLILIGFSWGAWLSFVLAGQHPELVSKLILIGSGSFEEKYSATLEETRLERLSSAERKEVTALIANLEDSDCEAANAAFARLGAILARADAYDPVQSESVGIHYQVDIYRSVWKEAAQLRRSGRLLAYAKRIACPVIAFHGDHDPHPSAGVEIPLSRILSDFRFIQLKNCGHKPWIERQARESFYHLLKQEVNLAD